MPPLKIPTLKQKVVKAFKAVLGIPFYTYKIYSRLVSLEAKLENYLNEVNCDVKSIQYHAGIKTSVTDSIPYEQTLKSILNSDYSFDTFRIEPIVKSTTEYKEKYSTLYQYHSRNNIEIHCYSSPD